MPSPAFVFQENQMIGKKIRLIPEALWVNFL
jgi:hypothetical protein